jgi:hypothetical protein
VATVAPAETEEPVQAPTDEPSESAPSDLMQYSAPPELQIDPAKYYAATIETEKGILRWNSSPLRPPKRE